LRTLAALLVALVALPATAEVARPGGAAAGSRAARSARRATAPGPVAPAARAQGDEASASEAAVADRATLAARWREALELDLAAQVLGEARERLAADPEAARDGVLLALHARALAATGGAEEARRLLTEARPSEATRGEVEVALARLDLARDHLDAVERRLAGADAAPVRWPEVDGAWIVLARARARRGELASAVPLLKEFVRRARLSPEAPSAWHLLSRAALEARDLESARRFRDEARQWAAWQAYHNTRRIQARANPADPLPRLGLAQLWASVEELGRARAEVAEALRLAPDLARAWALAGELERKAGEPDRARASLTRALELDPDLADARHNRALLALEAGDAEAARADLEAVLAEHGGEARYLAAHLALARLLLAAGEEEAARERHARYLELGGAEPLVATGR
jgi:tetratricopeptide (TPR) repeat protein